MLERAAVISLLLIFLYATQTETCITPEKYRALLKKCYNEQDDLEFHTNYTIPETEKGKCAMLCILKTLHLLSETGEYNLDTVLASFKVNWDELPESKLKEVAEECDKYIIPHYPKQNTCEYGFLVAKCIRNGFTMRNMLPQPPKQKVPS